MSTATLPDHFTRLTELDEARTETNPGVKLDAIRRAARALHDRICEGGPAVSVRTYSLVTFPYPTKFGLGGAARSLAPFVMMCNRVQLVQVAHDGELINILVNPSDPVRNAATPYFARIASMMPERFNHFIMSRRPNTVESALDDLGVRREDIDYITYDHLHTQDVRGWIGSDGYFPNAKLLAQAAELRTMEHAHPLQRDWYCPEGIADVQPDRILSLDGDYMIGNGFAMVRTPGHTEGNHSLCMVTDRGLWTVSENGVAVESYAPECSEIPGLRKYAREADVEVILNGNTRENSLDQYTSMILEKTLADPVPDRPEFPQHFPSSELVKSVLAPGLAPTYSHGAVTHGVVRTSKSAAVGSSSSAA